ncbi:MAG: hypothetical protein H3Z53_05620 [archaeon]|nr:hypothetical protein [archaeon]MCP8313835.1 hypothetical protein [archaeon]
MAIRLDQVKNWLASNIATRADVDALLYYDEPYMVCRGHKEVNHICSWWSLYQFGFGTYEFKGKLGAVGANTIQYLGLFEHHHGWWAEGGIFVWNEDGEYRLTTTWAGLSTTVVLAGQDWTKERTFRVVWDKTKVELYVDGIKVATITTNVPQEPMALFNEVSTFKPSAPAFEPTVYFNLESFKKVA